jgi:thiol-disulfide isomerase/thioredoxin
MRRWVVVVGAVLALAGCAPDQPSAPRTGGPGGTAADPVASPFDACPAAAGPAPADRATDPGPATVAGLVLPCFTGGEQVDLGRLGRPAVINLWASWCAPCRTELPALQRLADAAGDDLVVLGVITGDTRTKAAALAEDLAVTFPAVFDPAAEAQRTLGPGGLPLTALVDADGQVRYTHRSGVLTLESATDLVRTHLGVEVS